MFYNYGDPLCRCFIIYAINYEIFVQCSPPVGYSGGFLFLFVPARIHSGGLLLNATVKV